MAFGRYKFANKNVSPEVEAALGYSFGTIGVGSTNLSATGVNETASALRFYVAPGIGFAWAESTSIHLSLGYSYIGYASKNYTSTLVSVHGESMSGIFAKSMMRFIF
jgi:hypothetical protein